jgi:crotonobetainyl-CoA:carnitine CoA-transferase CaiB-like acyl-CoA transferase
LWHRFCDGFAIDPDLEGMATNSQRVDRRSDVIDLVSTIFRAYDTEPLLKLLDQIGVPAGKVRNVQEVYEWEQTKSQGLLVDVEHATLGTVTLPGPPLRFFESDGTEVTETRHLAPPPLGGDEDLIRTWLEEAV